MKNKTLIKQIREKIDMMQSELAKELGITQPHISQIENGIRAITFELAYKIKKLAKKHGIKLTIEDIRPESK